MAAAARRQGDSATDKNSKTKLSAALLNAELTKRPHKQRVIWDSKQPGLCVLISRGAKDAHRATVTFRVAFYLKNVPGKPQYVSLGRYPDGQYTYQDGKSIVASCADIDAMRRAASTIRNRAKDQGIDPRRPLASNVFADVVKDFIDMHAKAHRTWRETERIFERYVLPQWRFKSINDIDRAAVTHLLDKIQKKQIRYKDQYLGGAIVATYTLKQISTLFNWHATRVSDFTSPIVKGMRRRRADETVARLRADRCPELDVLGPKVARWAADNIEALRDADPDVPACLQNRAADNWRPLIAIADVAGGEWPARVRQIAELAAGRAEAAQSDGVLLLSDIRAVFAESQSEQLKSADLATALANMEGRPWAECGGKGAITKHRLAQLLSPYGIGPQTIRIGAVTAKGYLRKQFDDVFERYLPPAVPSETVTT